MTIFTISGKARHGKDTFAQMMAKAFWDAGKTAIVIHYADVLKHICKWLYGWDGVKDEAGRALLQRVGTDIIRAHDDDFFVHFIATALRGIDTDYVLIADARFPNEIYGLQAEGYDVVHIRINRPDFNNGLTDEQKRHPSETALDDVKSDILINNEGGLDALNFFACAIARRYIHET